MFQQFTFSFSIKLFQINVKLVFLEVSSFDHSRRNKLNFIPNTPKVTRQVTLSGKKCSLREENATKFVHEHTHTPPLRLLNIAV